MRPLRYLALIAFWVVVTPLHAQKKKTVAPVNTWETIDAFVEKAQKAWHVPGLALAVVKNDKIIYAKGYGFRDVEQKLPVTPQTLFSIASNTKAFTAFSISKLAEEGKLDLNKPIREQMPYFRLQDQYATEQMTPIDLLTHRSGMPRHDLTRLAATSREELVRRLVYLEPTASFRSTYQYNNLMYLTAAHLVDKITGNTWEAFVKAKILQPLQMNSTCLTISELEQNTDHAFPYLLQESNVVKIPYTRYYDNNMTGAGGINSNVADLANWVMMHLQGGNFGGQTILKKAFHQRMFQPQMVIPSQSTEINFFTAYGLGWTIGIYKGHERNEHGGNINGFSSNIGLFPRDSLGIVVLTNLNGNPLPVLVRNFVADQLLNLSVTDWIQQAKNDEERASRNAVQTSSPRQTNTQPSHPIAAYAGKYQHPAYGTIDITKNGEQLIFKFNREETSMLQHYHYDIFEWNDPVLGDYKLDFRTSPSSGKIEAVEIEFQTGVKPIVFRKN